MKKLLLPLLILILLSACSNAPVEETVTIDSQKSTYFIPSPTPFPQTPSVTIIESTNTPWMPPTITPTLKKLALDLLLEFAGEYYFGDGLGLNQHLTINSNGTYHFIWTGCLGVYAESEGSISVKDGMFYLENTEDIWGLSEVYRPIWWGERRYLISPEEHTDLCNLINQGWEPRSGGHGFIFLNEDDVEKSAGGLPSIPEEWKYCILEHPIEGKILEVIIDDEAYGGEVVMDIGSAHGVFIGMELWARNATEKTYCLIHVVSIAEESSTGNFYLHSLCEGLKEGDIVTSQ